MKLDLRFWQQPLAWSAVASWLSGGFTVSGRGLLVRHWRVVVRSLFAVAAAVAVGGALVLLYLEPGEGGLAEETLEPLDVAALERLVVWKEERARTRAAQWAVTVRALEP